MEELLSELIRLIEQNISDEKKVKSIFTEFVMLVYEYDDDLLNSLAKDSDLLAECYQDYLEENIESDE